MTTMAPNQRQRQLLYFKKDYKKFGGRKFSKIDESSNIELIHPGIDSALALALSVRFCSAIWCHVTDCDETYNYWEPSHFLLYGSGQQTWEYSPQYALRSYVYLLIHMVPVKLYDYFFELSPITVFYFIRCILSSGCALAEVYFYKNICKEFGIHIGRLTFVFLIFSSGMYIASAAFLPSSFSMYLSTVAIGAWYARQYELAIFATAISALLGWPFAALLGVPLAVEMLHRGQLLKFLKWAILSGAVILFPTVWIDSIYYGKLTVAPVNIILYNVFTNHGPNLYGTEPASYYIINGFLNFNFVFIGSLATPIFLFLVRQVIPDNSRDKNCLSYWYSLAPLYLWLFVFLLQPHKEERFLFPIYPMICLAGAITVDAAQKLYFFAVNKIRTRHVDSHYIEYTFHITLLAIITCAAFGLARTAAIYKGYSAPMEVLSGFDSLDLKNTVPDDTDVNFCVGKEWHRFPSSFFFPGPNWKLRYLKSEFRGQLPQPYLPVGNATRITRSNFNDMNNEESSRYFEVDDCHFLLDLDSGTESILEPNYSRQSNFKVIKTSKFLITTRSHPLFRAFYVPLLSSKMCTYGSYNLLQNIKFASKYNNSVGTAGLLRNPPV